MRMPPVTFCDGRLFYVLHNMLVYTTGAVGTALETIPYVYGDSNWKDKLTSYNGQTITYDAIGNPTNDGTWTYTWQAGRQLKQMSAEGTSISFKYDHNGMRVQKVVQQFWHPETTNYIYHGKTLTHMTVDYTDFDEVAHQDEMHFFYDAQSRPVKVKFNGTMYTYLSNLQGDIVGILDNAGTLVVEYEYDAWGKPLNTTGTLVGTLGKRNPFRYRGYVYDAETGLYYLRSRYYHWTWNRFINADIVIMYNRRLLDQNLFTYCGNSTPTRKDPSGKWFIDKLFEILEISITMYLMSFSKYPDNKINVSGTHLGDTINERIRQTNQYKTKISSLASVARSAENKTITQTVDFYFDPHVAEEMDLGLSFRRISMDVTVQYEEDIGFLPSPGNNIVGTAIVTYEFTDRYDFANEEWDDIVTIINDLLGYYPQQAGITTPYDITVSGTFRETVIIE